MIVKVKMPRLSDTMTEGYINQWHKGIGDYVSENEPLVELETDKSTVVYSSPVSGNLVEMVAASDNLIRVGEVIASVDH